MRTDMSEPAAWRPAWRPADRQPCTALACPWRPMWHWHASPPHVRSATWHWRRCPRPVRPRRRRRRWRCDDRIRWRDSPRAQPHFPTTRDRPHMSILRGACNRDHMATPSFGSCIVLLPCLCRPLQPVLPLAHTSRARAAPAAAARGTSRAAHARGDPVGDVTDRW